LGYLMLLLDDTSVDAVCVDTQIPGSAAVLGQVLQQRWPRLVGRVHRERGDLAGVEARPGDLVVSAHACGALTDQVINVAVRAGARLGVLPCCHDQETCDTGQLGGWMDVSLAIDATRAAKLRACGYQVFAQTIPEAITPKNRLLLASPRASVP